MWEIVDYKQKYLQEMLEMTIENYGIQNDISNLTFIKHEYFSNPDGEAFIKLALDTENNRLAGQYIVVPRKFVINGRFVECVLSLNTLTRNEYRGQQVFTKLAEAVYEECKNQKKYFCYGAPNQNSFHGFIKKLDFRNIGDVPLYLKILDPLRIVCDKIRIPYNDHRSERNKSRRKAGKNKSDIAIVGITNKNVQLFDLFWEKIKCKYPVTGVRNAKYVKWRYLNVPLRNYCIYMVLEDHLPCGYIIGRISEVAGMRCGMIVDFLVDTGRKDVGGLLLKKIIWKFRQYRIGLLGCLMQKECEEAICLEKKGFFVCPRKLLPQPFPIILRQFHCLEEKDRVDLENFSHWFFTMGDYDVI